MSGSLPRPELSVCIPTYKRPVRLKELLSDVLAQTHPCDELIIVDNDPDASAREVVQNFTRDIAASHTSIIVKYEVQPIKNISITRNRTIALATATWLAFIDDDERAPANWLELMLLAASTYGADGILAPVVPVVPESAPGWIKRGGFYDLPRAVTGQRAPASHFKMGNVLLRGEVLRAEAGPFDPAYGTTGGEDGDMLCRLELKGVKLVWSDDAIVHEPVEQKRLSARWLWMRAMRGGQDFARHFMQERYGKVSLIGKIKFALRASVQMVVAAAMSVIALPLGLHRAMRWSIKAAANFGKLSYMWGWHYQEYA